MARIGFDRGEDAGGLAGFADALPGVFDGGPHFRMVRIAEMPQCRGKIAGTNEQSIHAIDGGNRLDFLPGGAAFNLHQHAKLIVDALEIVLHPPVAVRAV